MGGFSGYVADDPNLGWRMAFSICGFAGLVYGGYLLAALLVILYLGRLIILDANNPLILGPAALAGFLLGPGWYTWLGLTLLGARQASTHAAGASR